MTTLLSDLHLSAWRNFITAHARLIEIIDREMETAETLPLQWYDVLIELYEAENGRLRMYELADKVVLTRSNITRLADKLEEAGYLVRQPDPADRRGSFVAITEAGKEALRQAWPVYAEAINRYFAQYLMEEEAATLRETFGRILKESRE